MVPDSNAQKKHKMKLHKDCLLEKTCASDPTRTAINTPFLDIKEGQGNLIATNGKAIAVIPVEIGPDDVQGHIPIDGLKAARKSVRGKGGQIEATANGAFTLPTGQSFPRPTGPTFPNWRQVIPAGSTYVFEIGLDAKLLLDLVQAMGGKGQVRLSFTGKHDPIIVNPMPGALNHDGGKGVLMPVRIS